MVYRQITLPRLDEAFAYYLGLLLGDGFVGARPNLIYLVGHLTDERDYYDRIVIPLTSRLFGIHPHPYIRKGQQAYVAHFQSVELVNHLKSEIGFPTQAFHKFVPQILCESGPEIIRAFLAGLFDSDGCLVFSKKTYRLYRYPAVEIKSVTKPVVDAVTQLLRELGFRASVRKSAESWVATVNGDAQLAKWMKQIGSHNIKHLSKYLLWRRSGSCPPHTTTPQRLEALHLDFDSFYPTLLRETGIDALALQSQPLEALATSKA